jgi:hypothetical protein
LLGKKNETTTAPALMETTTETTLSRTILESSLQDLLEAERGLKKSAIELEFKQAWIAKQIEKLSRSKLNLNQTEYLRQN